MGRNPNGNGAYRKLKDGRYAWRQQVNGITREVSAKTIPELKEKIKNIGKSSTSLKLTTGDWFDKWLDSYVKPLKKPATYNQYNIIYQTHIKGVIGKIKLRELKNFDLLVVIATMHEKNLSAWTMKHARKIMKIALDKAVESDILSESPMKKVEIPSKQAKEKKVLTKDELAAIFESLKDSRWIWSVKFMLVTGIRRGEMLALTWSDIDIQNKRMSINKSNSLTGLGDTKSSKVHYVPLSDKAIYYLQQQKEMLQNESNPILHNDEKKKTMLIFPNESGIMLRPNSYYTMLSRYAAKVNIKASPHCLRHTFVYMTRESLSLKELQSILGHDESTTTLDIYGDMINQSTDKTAERLDTIFSDIDKVIDKKEGKIIQFKKKA